MNRSDYGLAFRLDDGRMNAAGRMERLVSEGRAWASALIAALALLAAPLVPAADVYWDGGSTDILSNGDGASLGGAGTWDTTILNWDAGAGLAHAAWTNANNDTAIFGGASGTVTLGAGIAVGGLTFETPGYILTGDTLTFGTAGTIRGNQANQASATISSILAGGAAIARSGSGTVTLNGSSANTFNGGLVLNGGTLLVDFANLDTPTDLINSGNTLALGGGILSVKGKSSGDTGQTLGNVTVNAGGGQILGNKNGGAGTTINLGTLTATASGGSLLVGNATTTAANAPVITTTTDKDATGIHGGRVVLFNGTANTGYDWASTETAAPGPFALSAYSGYSTLPTSGGESNVNYKMTAATALEGSFSVNTLKIENPASNQALALGENTLTIESGGVLKTGANSGTSISGTAGGTRLTAGNGSGSYDLVVFSGAVGNGLLTISAVIGDNGANAVNLVKSGPGALVLTGANTYSGNTYANAGILDFAASNMSGFGGGSGRNIYVAAGAGVKRNASNNDFLQRIVETADEITIGTGTTGNALDFSSSDTGANLPNAFLGNWAGNGAKAEYSGVLTPANNTYRLGSPISSGLLGITGTLTDNDTTPRSLIVGGNRVELVGIGHTFSGDTVIRTGGRLFLGNNLALQNSALDTGAGADSIAGVFTCSAGTGTGKITGDEASPSPTFGGLKGSRNLLSAYSAAGGGNNASVLAVAAVTGFTLNVGTGKTCTYSGAIADFAAGTTLTKTGSGTQVLNGANTYSGATTVSNGTLLVNGSIGAGAVTVCAGATLGGTGTVSGAVTVENDGILSPGASPGTLTLANGLTLGADSRMDFELGSESDQLVINGDLALGGRLRISDSGGFGTGTNTLITYSGTLSGSTPAVESAPAGYTCTVDTTSQPGEVWLVVTSAGALTPFEQWQILYFGSTNAPNGGATDDWDGDGSNNGSEFGANTNPTNALSALKVTQTGRGGADILLTWTAAGVRTNRVQAGTDLMTTNFVDVSGPIVLSAPGDTTTNYLDAGGATNAQPRFYRIRVEP